MGSSGRALGSAVEHRLHTAGVSGSNPLAPTNFRLGNIALDDLAACRVLPPDPLARSLVGTPIQR